ncbi:hypothetical protein R6Z07M_006271 [Ovis aries]
MQHERTKRQREERKRKIRRRFPGLSTALEACLKHTFVSGIWRASALKTPMKVPTLLDVWGIFESLAGRKDTVRGPAAALPCTSPPKGSGHPSQKWQALAPCSDPLTHPIRSADFPAEPALES